MGKHDQLEPSAVEEIPADMPESEAREIADMLLSEIHDINDQIEDALLQSNAGLNVDKFWLKRAFHAKRFKKAQMRAYLRHADKIVRLQKYDVSNRRLQEKIEEMARKHKQEQANLLNSAKLRETALLKKMDNIRRAAEESAACAKIAKAIIKDRVPDAYDDMLSAFSAAQTEIRKKWMGV